MGATVTTGTVAANPWIASAAMYGSHFVVNNCPMIEVFTNERLKQSDQMNDG